MWETGPDTSTLTAQCLENGLFSLLPADIVLVKREVESDRPPFEYNVIFGEASLGRHLPTLWRVVQPTAAEAATGFKKKNMGCSALKRPSVGGKTKLVTKK